MPTTIKPKRQIFSAARTSAATAVNIAATGRVPVAHPQECCCPACVGLECLDRTRYFSGQLLTEADLNNEQSYWLAKSRLHNRYLHGWGVVCGMQVVCSECDGWVTVKPGYAIDPCGNDIIVCCEQPFNVIKAIQACCTPSKQTANCAPLRSTPPATCQDAQQTWCITIEYQEQPSRMVAPLKQATPKSGGCNCGGSKGGCGCGCGGACGCGGSKNGSSNGTSACSCAQVQTNPSIPSGACEPTRINEGFRLCVVPAPQTPDQSTAPAPGTLAYQFGQCYTALYNLLVQRPTLSAATDPASEQQDYQIVCNYLRSVQNAFGAAYITHCQLESALNGIHVPPPPVPDNGTYLPTLNSILTEIAIIIFDAAFDCFCSSLVPPCPADPCDDRLILACVTVQNGKIINICYFGGRKQVVTFPNLYYWLSLVGFDKALDGLQGYFEGLCCGDKQYRAGLFGSNVYQKDTLTTAGITNPAAVTQMMTTFISQKFGAAMVNAISPSAQAVDLRPLVGLNTDAVNSAIQSYNINPQNITTVRVDADPAWTDDAVASSPQFAPAAFSVGDNLTMFIKGKMVVGFEVTDPVTALRNHVQNLQLQVDRLTGSAAGNAPQDARSVPKKKH